MPDESYREVHKAIIPAGGQGTRLRPLSYAVPKELFPIQLRPMLEYSVEEAVLSGVHELCIVVSPGKEDLVRAYFEAVPPRDCSLQYVVQPEPAGLMDAIARGADFTGGEPFAVLLPDNIFTGPDTPALKQLLDLWSAHDSHVVGLTRVSREEALALGARGAVKLAELPEIEHERSFRVDALGPEKRGVEPLPGEDATVSVGRYVFEPEILERVEESRRRLESGELDDVPIVGELAREGRLLGHLLEGEYYDVGNPIGYWRANLHFSPADELVASLKFSGGS